MRKQKANTRTRGGVLSVAVLWTALGVLAALAPRPVRADAVVGIGTAASCTEAALNAALAGGGNITFNCGVSPVTITITSLKYITANTSIDGGSLITLSGGGATRVFVVSSAVTLANLTIRDGAIGADRPGGAIVNAGGTLTVTNSTFSGNNGGAGGAIDNNGTLAVTNSTFFGNNVSGAGGAIYNEGMLTVTNSTFSGNGDTAGNSINGGAIYNKGTLTATNSTFSGNNGGFGGAVYNAGGTLTVISSIFPGNSGSYGGAIDNDELDGAGGTLTVTDSTFSGNNGGAIYNANARSTLVVTNSTFSNHYATAIDNKGTLMVTNSTLTGNNGGAIYNEGGPLLAATVVTNSTFSGNNGAILNGGTLTLTNTIVANSAKGRNCGSTFIIKDGGHNLDDGTSCGFSAAHGSLSSTNPQLDPAGLRDNGGPTQTVALCTAAGVPAGCAAASPAIDAGDQSVCAAAPVNDLDQRGFVRPGAGHTHCSIGAYEAGGPAPVACVGDCGGTSTVAINDIITLVNIDLGNAEASACAHGIPSGAEVNVALIIQAVNNALNGCP